MKAYRTGLKTKEEISEAVNELLVKMTIDEKAGQLYQSVGSDITAIGSNDIKVDVVTLIREGRIGSMIQVDEPENLARKVRHLQDIAVNESRLGIPLLICQDVIHGYETVLPIPLAWACSFDPELVRECVRTGAEEASVSGIDLAFSPMVDIVRDPRWGRVCESAGEDPYLGARMAEAEVFGFRDAGILSCLKHFIGYGAAEAGRDYNTVELSNTTLFNTYLPPFLAGIKAGADSVMTSFNVMDGIPMVANEKYTRKLLRDEIGFGGIVISDYGAFMETMKHGIAEDEKEAALKCFKAAVDIEMTTDYYIRYLPELVKNGIVSETLIDEAVRRILTKKYEAGLMDDPYIHISEDRIPSTVFTEEHRRKSEELALESAVLLENNGVLPLDRHARIALVGPYATETDHAGAWSFSHKRNETVTIHDGLVSAGFVHVECENATGIFDELDGGIERAVSLAEQSDVIVLAVGESSVISGEACSRQDITIPGEQKKLIEKMLETGKPVVIVLVTGRPLLLSAYKERASAILLAWDLGSNAGGAIAKLLSGDVDPSGRLAMSFPYSTGQIPVYYNHLNTGRPAIEGSTDHFESKWLDGPVEPLYPFGYGLSYSSFSVSDVEAPSHFSSGDDFRVSCTVANTGARKGTAVVQVYIKDIAASISRPVKELKGFRRIELEKGESRRAEFVIPADSFGFFDSDFGFHIEPGRFQIFIGLSSRDEDLLKTETVLTEAE